MALSLRTSLESFKQYGINSGDNRSERDIASSVLKLNPNHAMARKVADASWLDMQTIELNDFLGGLGYKAQQGIDNLGAPKFVGMGANTLINSTAEYGGILLSALAGQKIHKFVGLAGLGMTALGSGNRTYVESADMTASVGAALSIPLSMLGANIGGKLFLNQLKGQNATKLRKGLTQAAGNFVGATGGDLLEIAMSSGQWADSSDGVAERTVKNLSGFFGDPNEVGAYLIAQTPFAAVGAAQNLGKKMKEKVTKRIQATTSLDQTFNSETEVRDFLHANNVPTYPQNNFAVLAKIADDVKRNPVGFSKDTARKRVLDNLASNIGGHQNLSTAQKLKVEDLRDRESESKNQAFLNKQQELLALEGFRVETSEAGDINRLFKDGVEMPVQDAPQSIKPILDQIHKHFIDSKSNLFHAEETVLKFNIVSEIAQGQRFKVASAFPDSLYNLNQLGGEFQVPSKLGPIGEVQLSRLRNFRRNDPRLEPYRHRFYHAAKMLTLKGYMSPETLHRQFGDGLPVLRIKADLEPILAKLDLLVDDLTPEPFGNDPRRLAMFKQNLDRAPIWDNTEPMFSLDPEPPRDFLYLNKNMLEQKGLNPENIAIQLHALDQKLQTETVANARKEGFWIENPEEPYFSTFVDGDDIVISTRAPGGLRAQAIKFGATEIRRPSEIQGEQQALFSVGKLPNKAKAFNSAKKTHGVTTDISQAGFILPDGSMLDFERNTQDPRAHTDISYTGMPNKGGQASQTAFMQMGAIRIDAEHGSIELYQGDLTNAQLSRITEMVNAQMDTDGLIGVDVWGNSLSEHQSFTFHTGTKTKKVVNIIKRAASGEQVNIPERQVPFKQADDQTLWSLSHEPQLNAELARESLNQESFSVDQIGNLLAENDSQPLVKFINRLSSSFVNKPSFSKSSVVAACCAMDNGLNNLFASTIALKAFDRVNPPSVV